MTWVTTDHGYLEWEETRPSRCDLEWEENYPIRSENDVGNYGPRLPGVEGDSPSRCNLEWEENCPIRSKNLEWEVIYSSRFSE